MNAFGGEPVAVKKPTAELVAKIEESVCTALTLAGVGAYEAWASNPSNVENEELADLVSSIYAAMKAQEITLEAQISEDACGIQVTPEMVEAGQDLLDYDWDPDFETTRAFAERIYRVMQGVLLSSRQETREVSL